MGTESRGGFTPTETEGAGGQLERLWNIYGFPGNAPKAGTPVEKRLQEKCREYAEKVVKDTIDPARSRTQGSESLRRDLHDEVSVMIFGKRRAGLDSRTAEQIGDFACELALGGTLDEIVEEHEAVTV